MLTRKDLEHLGIFMSDEQWKENCKIFDEIYEKEWEDAHPLDD